MDEAHENFNRTASRSVAAGGGRFAAGGLEFSVLSCLNNELPPGLRVLEREHPYCCLSFSGCGDGEKVGGETKKQPGVIPGLFCLRENLFIVYRHEYNSIACTFFEFYKRII